MAGDFGIVYPLWNHIADAGGFLDRVAGEVGIDHLTIPVVTGPWTQFRLRLLPESPYFHTEGGWHYPFNAKLFSALGARPKAAKWFGSKDILGVVRDRADDLGLTVYFRLDVPHAATLIANSSHLRQRNAWGDTYHDSPACMCNPETRELFRLTIEDLTRYDPAGFQLFNARIDLSTPEKGVLAESMEALLNTCFCAGCRQISASVVDPDQAARSVRADVEKRSSQSTPKSAETEDELNVQDEPEQQGSVLRDYDDARDTSVIDWVRKIMKRYPARRFFRSHDVDSLFDRVPPRDLEREPSTPILRLSLSAVLPLLSGGEQSGIYESLETLRPHGAVSLPLTSRLETLEAEQSSFVQMVSRLTAGGATFLDFEQVDTVHPNDLRQLKQAVRYARRS
ncbi:MAG: hypothetical protein IH986_12865 [Planctomycetes bacterium]|nr:hypothetical protein [Planctomycetota bacterium]